MSSPPVTATVEYSTRNDMDPFYNMFITLGLSRTTLPEISHPTFSTTLSMYRIEEHDSRMRLLTPALTIINGEVTRLISMYPSVISYINPTDYNILSNLRNTPSTYSFVMLTSTSYTIRHQWIDFSTLTSDGYRVYTTDLYPDTSTTTSSSAVAVPFKDIQHLDSSFIYYKGPSAI